MSGIVNSLIQKFESNPITLSNQTAAKEQDKKKTGSANNIPNGLVQSQISHFNSIAKKEGSHLSQKVTQVLTTTSTTSAANAVSNSNITPANATTSSASATTATPSSAPGMATTSSATTDNQAIKEADSKQGVIPNQFPTPSERASKITQITFAEALSKLPTLPENGIFKNPDDEIDCISYQLCQQLCGILASPFRNYLGHLYDIVTEENRLSPDAGSLRHQRHIRNTAIIRFCDGIESQLMAEVREKGVKEKIKQRLLNAWRPFDNYAELQHNTATISVFTDFFQNQFMPLANEVSNNLGQEDSLDRFPFAHKPYLEHLNTCWVKSREETTNQILTKLGEMETKSKLDSTHSTTTATTSSAATAATATSTAVAVTTSTTASIATTSTVATVTTSTSATVSAEPTDRRAIVRRHVDELYRILMIAYIPELLLATTPEGRNHTLELTVLDQYAYLRRISTTEALDEDLG